MRLLILTKEKYGSWLWGKTSKHFGEHDVHCFGEDNPYPFSELETDYDAGISFMHTRKVPANQINTHPWFNFHPAPLPEYKGRNLCYHAIMNGEKQFGATLHYMDENFDTGSIIETRRFPIANYWTAEDVSRTAIAYAQKLFTDYLPRILAGEEFIRIPNVGGRYYKKESIEDFVGLNDYQDKKVRAITYGKFYPKINVGGVMYKIVKDE